MKLNFIFQNLKKCIAFHGFLIPKFANEMLKRNGDFVVHFIPVDPESGSQPAMLAVTVRWNDQYELVKFRFCPIRQSVSLNGCLYFTSVVATIK